ncbi:hypothetical protein GCM10025868_42600 [Angustibacter aerolatus]|uniref:Uncharacterized protein n=1 Tax=Angustibacter aerolatus TaxID=1162965 RepID=A0ABQ6JL64_9ACTN|nr:hypothetical protein GCM10025868_42600 [Angustibacter aerolatus]
MLADPLRSPRYAARSLRAPGSLREKAAFARWAGLAAARHADRLKDAPDEPYGATLRRNGIDGALARSVVQPFLAGVLGEDEGETSRRFVEPGHPRLRPRHAGPARARRAGRPRAACATGCHPVCSTWACAPCRCAAGPW